MRKKGNWTTLSSKIVYKNPVFKLREDIVIKPDKKKDIYAFLSTNRTVGMLPLDKNNNVYLCNQFRYIFKEDSWEMPRGFVDKHESLVDAGKRELLEEAGLIAKNLKKIGSFRPSIGLLDEEDIIFLARDLSFSNQEIDKFEIERVKKFSFEQALRLIEKNKILDGLTITAILRTKQFLKL